MEPIIGFFLGDPGDSERDSIYSNGLFFIYFHPDPGVWVIDDDLVADYWNELYYYDETYSENLVGAIWSNIPDMEGVGGKQKRWI